MKWEDRGRSTNLDDRRRAAGPRRAGIPLGIGGILLVVAISAITGVDLTSILGGIGAQPQTQAPVSQQELQAEEEQVRFVSFVLDDVQGTWSELVTGGTYPDATLVLYRDAVQSGCGVAPAAAGPFYCPNDTSIYVDLSFYDTLRDRYGAPGDFAQAYVVAHEIGHHVQNLLGTSGAVREREQAAGSQEEANQWSVRLELQADCYAGVWAWHANQRYQVLEPGDVEEGLAAAAAIGDDRLMENAGRRVTPDSFTHGSSAERQQWLQRGLESGDPGACNTFGA